MNPRFALPALLGLALAAPPLAAEPMSTREFAKQADLDASGDGLMMLVLPAEVMAETRPDLADVRITDRAGREVPFFVQANRPARPRFAPLPATVRDVERTEDTPEGTLPFVRERYVLASLAETLRAAQPARGGALAGFASSASGWLSVASSPSDARWELVLRTDTPRFVRSARVEVLGPDGASELVAHAPLFRVDGAERLRIPLPPHDGDLAVTLEGREGSFVGASFRFEPTQDAAEEAPAVVALQALAQESEGGTTRLRVARPLGLVPGVLRIASDAPAFARKVRILDARAGAAPVPIGAGTIARIEGVPGAEVLEVWLHAPPQGEELVAEIADLDSPPLGDLHVSALVRQPALVFPLADHGDAEPDGTLHFGSAQALRPLYDLASLAELFPDVNDRERWLASIDPGALMMRTLRDNPDFAPSPTLEFAMRPGAAIDLRAFAFRRTLVVPSSQNGLSRYRLEPEDVGAARADLADVRVTDANGRQWPLLLAADAAREWRNARISVSVSEKRASHYTLDLPAPGVRVQAIELETSTPFFHRGFRLTTRGADRERELARGALVRGPGQELPVRIALDGERVDDLALEIENGDDAPLEFERASVQIVLPEVFVAAPAGEYALLLGNPESQAPEYELERVRGLVLAVPSAPLQAGPLGANPAYSPARALAAGVRGKTLAVWLVLGVAVAVVAGLTLRAARSEAPSPPRDA